MTHADQKFIVFETETPDGRLHRNYVTPDNVGGGSVRQQPTTFRDVVWQHKKMIHRPTLKSRLKENLSKPRSKGRLH